MKRLVASHPRFCPHQATLIMNLAFVRLQNGTYSHPLMRGDLQFKEGFRMICHFWYLLCLPILTLGSTVTVLSWPLFLLVLVSNPRCWGGGWWNWETWQSASWLHFGSRETATCTSGIVVPWWQWCFTSERLWLFFGANFAVANQIWISKQVCGWVVAYLNIFRYDMFTTTPPMTIIYIWST